MIAREVKPKVACQDDDWRAISDGDFANIVSARPNRTMLLGSRQRGRGSCRARVFSWCAIHKHHNRAAETAPLP